jgi:lysophospholipase L1-like esterase
VALGDSITPGMGDPVQGRSCRGWAALLAAGLAPPGEVEFHNVAESGAQAVTLHSRQIPRALALRPHLASVVVGVNDTLRGSFNVTTVGAALADAIGALRAAGATVLTCRWPSCR